MHSWRISPYPYPYASTGTDTDTDTDTGIVVNTALRSTMEDTREKTKGSKNKAKAKAKAKGFGKQKQHHASRKAHVPNGVEIHVGWVHNKQQSRNNRLLRVPGPRKHQIKNALGRRRRMYVYIYIYIYIYIWMSIFAVWVSGIAPFR